MLLPSPRQRPGFEIRLSKQYCPEILQEILESRAPGVLLDVSRKQLDKQVCTRCR